MKKTNFLMLLMTSSLITLNAYAMESDEDGGDVFGYVPTVHLNQESGSDGDEEEAVNTSEYQFELLGDITKPAHKPYQGKFRITNKDDEFDSEVKTLSLKEVRIKSRFEIEIPTTIKTLHPSDPLPTQWGKAKEQAVLKFKYKNRNYRQKITRPKEYPLHGSWHLTDDLHNNQTVATLTLRAYKNQKWHTVDQSEVRIDHQLINTGPEISGRLFFDGDKIYQAKTKLLHYRDPRTGQQYSRNVEIRDGEIPSHQGKQIVYVEPFALGNDPLQHRDTYRGAYDSIDSINTEKISGREDGRLIYSDGTHCYLPDVTQEVWKQGHSRVGFFIASYKQENRLNFTLGTLVGNAGSIPEGLYHLHMIEDRTDKRIERWVRLGEDQKEIKITTNPGIASLPGMGATAPHFVPDDGTDETIRKLVRGIDEVKRRITKNTEKQKNNTKSLIVLGKSGKGKSTLVHGLAGIPLSVRSDGRIEPKNLADTLPGFTIGHGFAAGTSLPGVHYDEGKNITLKDCPGFDDPGDDEDDGARQDLINGYSIQEVFSSAPEHKVLLTISHSDLNDRAKEFMDALDKLTKLIPDDHELYQSTYLVVTKKKKGLLIDKFREITKKQPPLFARNERAKKLFQFIVKNRDTRVFEFLKPKGPGDYPFDRDIILDKIYATPSVPNPKFKLSFEPKTEVLAGKLAKRLNDFLTDYMKTEGAQRVVNHCRSLIDSHTGPIATLRKKLGKVVKKLKALQELSITPAQFSTKLAKIVDVKDVNRVIDNITFLKEKVKDDITFDTTRWANAMNATISAIEKLAASPTPEYDDPSKTLTLKEPILSITDITAGLTAHPGAEKIRVYSSNTFFIDGNMTRNNATCSFFAPRWNVVAQPTVNFTIDLSGTDNSTTVANGSSAGANGSPGAAGENGGHFYGVGVEFSQLSKLTVKTNGGKGGKGGKGATGKTGDNGVAGDENALRRFEGVTCTTPPQSFTDWHPTGEFNVKKDNKDWQRFGTHHVHGHMNGTKTVYTHGNNEATSGGDGGKKGSGGKGGHHGSAVIKNAPGTSWTHISDDGSEGDKGTAGTGGQGGLNGPIVQGTYISGMNGQYDNIWRNMFGEHCDKWECNKSDHWLSITTISQQSRASSGSDGDGANEDGRSDPKDQLTATELGDARTVRAKEFKEFYLEQAADPKVGPFVKVFPNLKS
ncbi:MAG: hypothetical protein BGO67_10330 [Alphaproteobacteria bacterium 41-28]|nr:MAG: hypothetical protein BGO67_10330 [Alphaproteobacteria bacterium 41-28]